VTGDKNDHLVMNSNGLYSFYDGKLNALGWAYTQEGQPTGSYAEAKLEHEYFAKVASSGSSVNGLTNYQRGEYIKMKNQIKFGNIVANSCGHLFFLAFDNQTAANAIRTLFGSQYPQMNIYVLGDEY
jgi:hypothetical protein